MQLCKQGSNFTSLIKLDLSNLFRDTSGESQECNFMTKFFRKIWKPSLQALSVFLKDGQLRQLRVLILDNTLIKD